MEQPVEVLRLRQAIEQFEARAPEGLPDGVLDQIKNVGASLSEFAPAGEDSPGRQEARQAAGEVKGTTGTGEHFSKAARGVDQPSPGQREALGVSAEIEKAAADIAERVKSGRGEGSESAR